MKYRQAVMGTMVLVLIILFISCKTDDDDPEPNPFENTSWTFSDGADLEFTSSSWYYNNSTHEGSPYHYKGNYTVSGNTATMNVVYRFEGGSWVEWTDTWSAKVDGDRLIIYYYSPPPRQLLGGRNQRKSVGVRE